MAGFLSNLISNIFGSSKKKNEEPDDGGLADFAKKLAKELEMEEKMGKRSTVSADTVLKVQHGKHGSKIYLLDTTDFLKAIVPELRESVAPVAEGILKSRCGDKGVGYMNVKALYIFHIRREDPVEEYNAAMDIIDDIGGRLLGDRYLKGDRRVHIPVAKIAPDELFNDDGSFDFKKVEESIDWVREAGKHGPCDVDWETGEVRPTVGSPEWQEANVPNAFKDEDHWEEQHLDKADKDLGDWERQKLIQEKDELGDWEEIHLEKEQKEENQWQKLETPTKKEKPKVKWTKIERPEKEEKPSTKKAEPPSQASDEAIKVEEVTTIEEQDTPATQKPKPQNKQTVEPTDLNAIDKLTLAFRPTWNAGDQAINTYAVCPYRKIGDSFVHGEQIYPDDHNPSTITKIDQAIAEQAVEHIQNTKQLTDKIIVLPINLLSLSIEKSQSPILALRELDENLRKAIWIEIVGVDSSASPSRISSVISAHHDKFNTFGLRFELGDVSRSLVERSRANFLSCDIQESSTHGLQMRGLDLDLPDILNLAKTYHMDICTWGLRNHDDLVIAMREGSNMLNGHALAKEMRKPGKVIPVPAEKLMSH